MLCQVNIQPINPLGQHKLPVSYIQNWKDRITNCLQDLLTDTLHCGSAVAEGELISVSGVRSFGVVQHTCDRLSSGATGRSGSGRARVTIRGQIRCHVTCIMKQAVVI